MLASPVHGVEQDSAGADLGGLAELEEVAGVDVELAGDVQVGEEAAGHTGLALEAPGDKSSFGGHSWDTTDDKSKKITWRQKQFWWSQLGYN